MSYVEWLRARGMLKVTAIVLGALLLCFAILRVTLQNEIAKGNAAFTDVGSSVATRVEKLADGSTKTTYEDPVKREHVVIVDRGWANKHIEVTEPTSQFTNDKTRQMSAYSVRLSKTVKGDMTTLVIDTNASVDVSNFFVISLIVGLIVATIVGGPLAKENDGHLELSWLRPASREMLALRTFGTDILGIVAAEVLGAVAALLAVTLYQVPSLTITWSSVVMIAAMMLGPIAWYAMLAAATASMKRGYGAIVGIAWPIAIAIPLLSMIRGSDNQLLVVFHAIVTGLAAIDPLYYGSFHSDVMAIPSHAVQVGALVALTLGYFAVAIVQWRRVEA
jgi:hypothetical protein